MKESELRKLYLSLVHLYGFVFTQDIYMVLDHYGVKYTKSQIVNDLKKRSQRMTQSYYVYKLKYNYYLVIDPIIDIEDVSKIQKEKVCKPFYFPKTYEDLLKYEDLTYKDENDQRCYNDLYNVLRRYLDFEDTKLEMFVELLIVILKYDDNGLISTTKYLQEFDIQFKSEKEVKKYFSVLQKVSNNLRLPINNGFTPAELSKLAGPIDINKVNLTMGPNMKEMFLNGESNPYEYLRMIENSEFPESMKKSFKKELQEVIDEIEKTPKA